MMTIAQFADRTGLSPSALRFYERKGLLAPAGRLGNGYRVYTEEQVKDAQLITSLRQADLSLADIRAFLEADLTERDGLLARWRREVAVRLRSIQIAGQYLGAMRLEQNQVHLFKWEEPVQMLWFKETVPLGPLPFRGAMARRARQLEDLGVPILAGGYARPLDLAGEDLTGEIGFQVRWKQGRLVPDGARLELVPPTLFATLECSTQDLHACHRVYLFARQFGLEPVGERLERYLPGEADQYQLMIAVMRNDA